MDLRDLQALPDEEFAAAIAGMSDDEIAALKEAERKADEEKSARLQGLGDAIAGKRAEAIRARHDSGIEEDWIEDEEFYQGIDDANRGDSKAWSQKPPGRIAAEADDTGSNIFLNLIGPNCDAAGASLADVLLPTDDTAWHFDNTPVPELVPFAKGELPTQVKEAIRADAQQIAPDDAEAFAQETEAKMVEQAAAMLAEARKKAQKAQKRIEDWHVECQYHAEIRKIIEDAARVGSGVLKGPIPAKRKQVAYKDGALVINEEIKPISRRIDYWNLYPAAGCGENIHDGDGIFEKDDIPAKKLRELIGVPGYLEKEIMAVLEEGPLEAGREHKPTSDMKQRDTKSLFEIWYYYGDVTKQDMEAAGCECDEDMDIIPANIVMVNNRVIKATINPLDSGEFPYDVMVWKKRRGMPWGEGVARQGRTPQKMINGAARNMMDNAGIAGGPMLWIDTNILHPADGKVEILPRKVFIPGPDAAPGMNLGQGMGYLKMDMMVNELQAIIFLGMRMMEEVTGLPSIMMGHQGQQREETLGQSQIRNNNANTVRRRIAKLFDDLVTEPHVRRYYAYLLQYGEDDEKGDFLIDASGSSNLVERAIQKEKMTELLNLSLNPVFKKDPKKVFDELLKSEKLDPDNFDYDDEEWEALVQQILQPQQQSDPRQAIAEMQLQIAQLKEEGSTARKQLEVDSRERVAAYQGDIDKAITEFEGTLKKELAEMGYQGDKDLQFDKLKTDLNKTVMQLTTTKELAGQGAPAKQLARPIVEPPQQAANGQSYQQ